MKDSDETCPSCGNDVYWPDQPSFWVVKWDIRATMSPVPIGPRVCSLACLITETWLMERAK